MPVLDDECCFYNKFSGALIGMRRGRGGGRLLETGRLLDIENTNAGLRKKERWKKSGSYGKANKTQTMMN